MLAGILQDPYGVLILLFPKSGIFCLFPLPTIHIDLPTILPRCIQPGPMPALCTILHSPAFIRPSIFPPPPKPRAITAKQIEIASRQLTNIMPSSPSSPIKDAAAAAVAAAFTDQQNNSPAGKLTPVRPSRLYVDGDDDESKRKASQNPSPSHGCHSPSKKLLRPSASSSKYTLRDLGEFEPTAIGSDKVGLSSVTPRSVMMSCRRSWDTTVS